MRKIIILTLIFFICLEAKSQKCSDIYRDAIEKYNNRNYIEAQKLFLNVVQSCGNYANVCKFLTECNSELSKRQDKQAQEIASLKEQNKKLEKEIQNASSNTDRLSDAAKRIKLQNDSINQLNNTITHKEREIADLNRRLSSTISHANPIANQPTEDNKVQKKYDSILTQTNRVIDSVGSINTTLEELKNKVNALTIDSINHRIEQLQNSIEKMQSSIIALNTTVKELSNPDTKQSLICSMKCWFCKWKIKRQERKKEKNTITTNNEKK